MGGHLVSQRPIKITVAVVVTILVVIGAAVPAFAKGVEIAVTGVVTDEQDKADGTPVYGIKDEARSTSSRTSQQQGYLLEGDYSAYVGQQVTVYGKPEIDARHRILDVSRIEE
jgi:hypothetical protein